MWAGGKSDQNGLDRVRFQKAEVPGEPEVKYLLVMTPVTALPPSLLGVSLVTVTMPKELPLSGQSRGGT